MTPLLVGRTSVVPYLLLRSSLPPLLPSLRRSLLRILVIRHFVKSDPFRLLVVLRCGTPLGLIIRRSTYQLFLAPYSVTHYCLRSCLPSLLAANSDSFFRCLVNVQLRYSVAQLHRYFRYALTYLVAPLLRSTRHFRHSRAFRYPTYAGCCPLLTFASLRFHPYPSGSSLVQSASLVVSACCLGSHHAQRSSTTRFRFYSVASQSLPKSSVQLADLLGSVSSQAI
jgi:hypothetical protein